MTVEIKMPKTGRAPSPGNKESVVASELPGSTVGVLEVHSVGKLVTTSLKTLSGSATVGVCEGRDQAGPGRAVEDRRHRLDRRRRPGPDQGPARPTAAGSWSRPRTAATATGKKA
jgi:hypothetical protein